MVYSLPNLGQLLIIIGGWLYFSMADDDPGFRIRSKTTSGNGCPNEHWVYVEAGILDPNATTASIIIGYMDFTPEISLGRPVQLASSSCQVALKLDQLREGYQFAVTKVTHGVNGHFDQWSLWTQDIRTHISYMEGGPVAMSHQYGEIGRQYKVDYSSDIVGHVDPLWSPCFEANSTAQMFINDRVTLGWVRGGWNTETEAGKETVKNAWLKYQSGAPPYSTSLTLHWQSCK